VDGDDNGDDGVCYPCYLIIVSNPILTNNNNNK